MEPLGIEGRHLLSHRHGAAPKSSQYYALALLFVVSIFVAESILSTDYVASFTNTTQTQAPPPNAQLWNFSDANMKMRQHDGAAHSLILYGHIHMAKTGGTSLNGVFANEFERVCGHKGYSYDAHASNERAKKKLREGKRVRADDPHDRVNNVEAIGFEDCDYISRETDWSFWDRKFKGKKFHGLEMELHLPCRESIDLFMSECNYKHRQDHGKPLLDCDAMASNDTALRESIAFCHLDKHENRFSRNLTRHMNVKCYDFQKQFTAYKDYMSQRLQPRRIRSTPYVKRNTNAARNKTLECLWTRPDLMAKVEKYLRENYDYYAFCHECMGTENEITRESVEG